MFTWKMGTGISLCGLLLVIINSLGCCENEDAPNDHLIVFVDKSASISASGAQHTEQLNRKMITLLDTDGDRFAGYFMHKETDASIYFALINFDAPLPAGFCSMGGLAKNRAKNEQQTKIHQFQGAVIKALQDGVSAEKQKTTQSQTDIWSTLETMSAFFKEVDSPDQKHAIYISDMEESMNGPGRRDFTEKTPADKAEAEAWAAEDAAWIQQHQTINTDALEGTTVSIYLPHGALDANKFGILKYYWQALFAKFGITEVKVNQ